MIKHLIIVASGGAVGACLRYLTGVYALRLMGASFPWGTLVVNVLGSFLMGLVAEYIVRKLGAGNEMRLLIMTGLLGGYTTFSAFSLDAVLMLERGAFSGAAAYIAANVIGSIAALMLGLMLARNIL